METTTPEQVQWRQERLRAIVTVGLPALSSHVFELNKLLGATTVDFKRASKIIRSDPGMTAQVLRMCNSALFGIRRRVVSIEQASIMMGSERLRTLVLTSSVMEFSGQKLPHDIAQAFWKHSFITGMLSERVAKWIDYSEPEQAYLGGLLHDVGRLPIMMVASEDDALDGEALLAFGNTSLDSEKAVFGMNHCQVGRMIGTNWNFFPSFIDIFENHHHPDRSSRDPHLVGIVAAADSFSEMRNPESSSGGEDQEIPEAAALDEFFTLCFPRLDAEERAQLVSVLKTEYVRALAVVGLNQPAVAHTAD